MADHRLALAHALLGGVEGLPADARGALVVSCDDRARGAVLVEDNRVCWASALGLERRLRELLGHAAPPSALVAQGLLSPAAAHAALRQHSIESLIALCAVSDPHIDWRPRSEPLRAATWFAATDLLAAVGAQLYPDDAETAGLVSIHPTGAVGASYVIGDRGELVVVRELGGERLGVATLRELGAWAAAALDATEGFTPLMVDRTLRSASACVAIGWRSARRVVHAVVIDDRAALGSALATIRARNFPLVVTVCVPWKLRQPLQLIATT